MRPKPKPLVCMDCPAYSYGVGFVEPEVPKTQRDLTVVGQGPGETEALFSRPFHPEAPSGRMLTRWLNEAGFLRTRVLLTNVVWCWMPAAKPKGFPKGNREPTKAEISYCRRVHLDPLLATLGSDDLIVTVGAPATGSLLQIEGVSKYLGTFNYREDLNGPEERPADQPNGSDSQTR